VIALEARGLVKGYGRGQILSGVDLRVDAGHAVLLEGSTGSGKSTLLRLLAGLLRPDAGEALVGGMPAREARARRGLGYLPQRVRLPPGLTAGEWLRLGSRLAGAGSTAAEAAQRTGVHDLLDRTGRTLSEGQLHLLGLASALVGSPVALLLDEPAAGLDPERVEQLRRILDEERGRGTAVLVTSHQWVGDPLDRMVRLEAGRCAAVS